MSTPAFMDMHITSSVLKLSEIAAISRPSVTITPSKPISFLRIPVRIVRLIVAGRYTGSPVVLDM